MHAGERILIVATGLKVTEDFQIPLAESEASFVLRAFFMRYARPIDVHRERLLQ